MKKVDGFHGEHRFLSNFFPARVELEGLFFATVEHAYQAAKSDNLTYRKQIQLIELPSYARMLGKKVLVRPGWESEKVAVMRELLTKKFAYEALRDLLLATGDAILVERNYWGDTFWGVTAGEGLNTLGQLLMEVRDEIRNNVP